MRYSIAVLVSLACVACSTLLLQGAVKGELVRVRTDDGIPLHAAIWTPSTGTPRIGIALATGTGGEFYSTAERAEQFAKAGFMVISMNRRDHGDKFGYYNVEPSALDHRYAIDLLAERGVEDVVLVGQSYGTVTVPYYVKVVGDPRVKALVLTAALGDLRAGSRIAVGGAEPYERMVSKAQEMVLAGRGKETFLMPGLTPSDPPMVHTYETFLDKRGPASKAVPYELMKSIELPILAIRDPADPLPATLPPAQQQLEASNKRLKYVLLPDIRNGRMDRAAHGFAGRQDELFGIIFKWLGEQDLLP